MTPALSTVSAGFIALTLPLRIRLFAAYQRLPRDPLMRVGRTAGVTITLPDGFFPRMHLRRHLGRPRAKAGRRLALGTPVRPTLLVHANSPRRS